MSTHERPPLPSYGELPTEQSNPLLRKLDEKTAGDLVDAIHLGDLQAITAVGHARHAIALAAQAVVTAIESGGRLIYVGCGTSGRLGFVDAAECPPTFGSPPSQVQAVIAGGPRALTEAVEGAEDDTFAARQVLVDLPLAAHDLVCGISASGVTPFVLAALGYARSVEARTVFISCGPEDACRDKADILIHLNVGPETIAGSTRMKAGLATKAVLHSLSTTAMIRLGRVYDNLMVDVRATNRKLESRAERIVSQLTGLPREAAAALLAQASSSPKVAAVMHHRKVSREAAFKLLHHAGGRLRDVIGDVGE